MLEQLKAILWLKIRLFKNQNRLLRRISVSISLIIGFLTVFIASLAGIAAYFLGSLAFYMIDDPGTPVILLFTDIIIFMFVMYRLSTFASEIQHATVIDMKKMLYLPLLSLKSVYFLNFSMTIFAPVFVIFHAGLLGFLAGLSTQFGSRMYLGMIPALAFYLMVSAWLHYFQGALANLMENKKKRRLVSVLVSLMIILLIQGPNLLNMLLHSLHERNAVAMPTKYYVMQFLAAANSLIPLGWLANSFRGLADGDYWLFTSCVFGMGLIAYGGVHAGYKATISYYLGGNKKISEPKESAPSPKRASQSLLDRRVPFVSDDTSTLALTEILTLFRHPKVRSQILFLSLIGAFFCVMQRNNPGGAEFTLGIFFLFQLSMVAGYLFSCFGTDVEAFRGLILLPTERSRILLAKNLALLPFSISVHIVPALVFVFWGKMTFSLALVWTMSILQTHIWVSIVGNYSSIYFPYRINMEMMRQASRGGRTFFSGVLSLISLPFLLLPVMMAVGIDPAMRYFYNYRGVSLGPALAAIFLAASFSVYRAVLHRQASALVRRETQILTRLMGDKE